MYKYLCSSYSGFHVVASISINARTAASVAETIKLPCEFHAEAVDVKWLYRKSSSDSDSRSFAIYEHSKTLGVFRERFRVEKADNGMFHLVILSLRREDSGIYVCSDEDSVWTYAIELNVSGRCRRRGYETSCDCFCN